MKTLKIARRLKLEIKAADVKKTVYVILLYATGCILTQDVSAQISDDHLLSGRGKSQVTVGSGVPLVGFAEYAYGIGDGFTVGIVAGIAPAGHGYGLRPRGILYQKHETFRVYMKSLMLYYPRNDRKGIEPWVFAWPSVMSEWKLESGIRLSAGVGVVASSCLDDLLGTEAHVPHDAEHHTHHEHPNEEPVSGQEETFMNGAWQMIQGGMTLPVNNRLVFQSVVSLAFDGFSLAGTRWVGRTPVVLVIGMTYHF